MDPANLSPSQYRTLQIRVNTPMGLARGAVRAISSKVRTRLKILVVPREVSEANEATCRSGTCGKFRELEGSPREPACDVCTCQGRWLRSKWEDGLEACPMGFWDNRGKGGTWTDLTVDGKVGLESPEKGGCT